jgi:TFIIS helical bundle-like domain
VTGIGKTVNYTRKLEGEVGELAKKLVTKWKDMVAEADQAEEKKPPVPLFSKNFQILDFTKTESAGRIFSSNS